MKLVDKVLTWFEDIIMIFGMLSATAILFINVVVRFVLKSGIVWAEEYARFAIIWIVLGACAAAVRTDAHMKITAIPDAIKNPTGKLALETIVTVIYLAFCVILLVCGVTLTMSMIRNHQVSPAMEIPLWWIYVSIPIGAADMIIRIIQVYLRRVKEIKGAKEGEKA